jgi:hypothetical protein
MTDFIKHLAERALSTHSTVEPLIPSSYAFLPQTKGADVHDPLWQSDTESMFQQEVSEGKDIPPIMEAQQALTPSDADQLQAATKVKAAHEPHSHLPESVKEEKSFLRTISRLNQSASQSSISHGRRDQLPQSTVGEKDMPIKDTSVSAADPEESLISDVSTALRPNPGLSPTGNQSRLETGSSNSDSETIKNSEILRYKSEKTPRTDGGNMNPLPLSASRAKVSENHYDRAALRNELSTVKVLKPVVSEQALLPVQEAGVSVIPPSNPPIFPDIEDKPMTLPLPNPQPPITRVTIGRIEIRAEMPPSPRTSPPAPKESKPELSLEDYLKQRDGKHR